MKRHNGMRPHDIAILLKIVSMKKQQWLIKELAFNLKISPGEISESINRSVIAGLMSYDKKSVNKLALLDFLKSGFRYVFPVQPGPLVRGIATAHSAPPLNKEIVSDEYFVWPHHNGNLRGMAIKPLYPKLPEACLNDYVFYELMALTDALRIGKVREQNIAFNLLKKKI